MKINIVEEPRHKFVKYDNNLFEVYVLDYDDNYHKNENAPTTEFEKQVRSIKARYRDINKFNGACAIYTEYMSYLEDKHGGPELFKLKKKAGLIDDYIPPKPRVKNTKELKYLKKNKIIIGTVGRFLIDDDKLDEVVDFYSDNMVVENIHVDQEKDKIAEKILDDDNGDKKMKSKYKHLKSQSFKDDSDFLSSYFKNKNYYSNFGKQNKKKNKKKDKLLIKDLMRADYDKYIHDDDYMEDSDTAPMTLYNGLLLSSGTTKELDVYHKLNEMGWNSYKLMKKGSYSSRVTNMFKPPKKKKKGKKGKKSKYNDMYDGLLIDIMTDNGFDVEDMDSFEEFQKEMLNMTSSNVFK